MAKIQPGIGVIGIFFIRGECKDDFKFYFLFIKGYGQIFYLISYSRKGQKRGGIFIIFFKKKMIIIF